MDCYVNSIRVRKNRSFFRISDTGAEIALRLLCRRPGIRGSRARQPGADSGKAGFDGVEDDADAFVEWGERAFHGVEREFFEFGQAEVEQLGGEGGFLGHRGIAHQAVVGIEADAEAAAEEQAERMVFEAGAGTGMEVAEQAHFQRDAAVENEKRVLLE